MFKRQKTGSVLCTSCGKLVGVRDPVCWNCGRRNPGLWGFGPVLRGLGRDLGYTSIVIAGCAVLYAATLVTDPQGISASGLFGLLSPSMRSLFVFGASGAVPVFEYGRWWTVLSASWLHGSLLHIFFNMLWVRQLAPDVVELYGAPRTVIVYTAAGIAGFALSSCAGFLFGGMPIFFLRGAQLTIGASAPIFGLLGALVYYGRRGGSRHISGQATSMAIVLFIFGFVMPNIDNYAHFGGFLGGYAMARWLDPLQPEKIDHMVWALVCMAATLASVIASLLIRPF
ncbi:MAG: rhomboid family intramembrane serine protease [Acidobacteriia bacterium]|nr:rhomboid family intramembrane serine protease [Terriglobia bacterium]